MIKSLDDFLVPLMQILERLPGRTGILDKVLATFEQKYRDQIDPELYTRNQSGNIRWNWRARWARQELKLIGFIDSPAKGVWHLTDDGHKWLEDHSSLTHLNIENKAKNGKQGIYITNKSTQGHARASTLKKTPPNKKEIYSELSPHAILDDEISTIRAFISGQSSMIPNSEKLCDWIFLCYTFKLYSEGRDIFTLIAPNEVHTWYYERTKKLARLCSMRANGTDVS